MGQSVLARAARSHSILVWSSGMLTLMAAWQAVEAAILACSVSMEMAAFSRSMPSRISVRSFSASLPVMPAGGGLVGSPRGALCFFFETFGLCFFGVFFYIIHLCGGRSQKH